jgi:hypothetical protein
MDENPYKAPRQPGEPLTSRERLERAISTLGLLGLLLAVLGVVIRAALWWLTGQ